MVLEEHEANNGRESLAVEKVPSHRHSVGVLRRVHLRLQLMPLSAPLSQVCGTPYRYQDPRPGFLS